jgi:hypothetical protein
LEERIYHEQFGYIGKIRCFGGSAAVQAEVTKTRKGWPTISVEFAEKGQGREYDWPNKQVLQITPDDLPAWLATLAGKRESLKLANYGADRNKGLELRQNDRAAGMLLVGLFPEGARPVPLRPGDVYWMSLQALAVIQVLAPRVESLSAIHLSALVRGSGQEGGRASQG